MRGIVEPRFTEPLYNEVLGITNDFLYPSNSKIYERGPQPRPQGFSLKNWVGREKALASAGHVSPRTP